MAEPPLEPFRRAISVKAGVDVDISRHLETPSIILLKRRFEHCGLNNT